MPRRAAKPARRGVSAPDPGKPGEGYSRVDLRFPDHVLAQVDGLVDESRHGFTTREAAVVALSVTGLAYWLPGQVGALTDADAHRIELRLRSSLARNMRALREQAGLTVRDAARRCGVQEQHWLKIEAGEVNSTLRTLRKIANGFGVDVPVLVQHEPGGAGIIKAIKSVTPQPSRAPRHLQRRRATRKPQRKERE